MNKLTAFSCITLLLLLLTAPKYVRCQDNDHIFPAAPPAEKYISFDKQGFIINGKKTFIVSAGLEYARIPHQLWQDRLLRLKRAGFNCIEIYTFWNFHEPHEGQFNFSGDHDLDAFLKLVKKMDMYAIVRVGPYYCAEWDLGGYPEWLHFKDSVMVRQPNAAFEKYTGNFFDKLIPIVSNNQINHGGAVILVQLENEHDSGWGTITPNSYFNFLKEKALSLGLQVPYFFSGLHHGGDPAGNGTQAFDNAGRPNPWFSTEFWSVWYNYYGSTQQDADTFGRRTWKIIAHGGGGYNYYMAHGGTNFGFTNNDEDAASYDYGAAVGQAGDLRPVYYQDKANALFARSFENILCNAADASSAYKNIVNDDSVNVYARHSQFGDIAFLDNHSKTKRSLQVNINSQKLPVNGSISLKPGEIMPIVQNFQLAPGIKLDYAVTRILGLSVQGNVHTLVIYGDAGSNADLAFSCRGTVRLLAGQSGLKQSANHVRLRPAFIKSAPVTYAFKSGSETVMIIAVDPLLANRTWFIQHDKKNYIITGPQYIGDFYVSGGHVKAGTESFWNRATASPAWLFDGIAVKKAGTTNTAATSAATVTFNKWLTYDAGQAAWPGFDDSGWLRSKEALQMGADNDLSAYAWYRTDININSAGDYVLSVKEGGDKATIFIDGKRVAAGAVPGNITIPQLSRGHHLLAVFTAHYGRNKLYNYYGAFKYKDAKGLSGIVLLQKSKTAFINNWKMAVSNSAAVIPSFDNAAGYKAGDDAFNKKAGYRWLRAGLPEQPSLIPNEIYIENSSDNEALYINDKRVSLPDDGSRGFYVPLNGLLNAQGKNTITILVENKDEDHKGGLNSPVEVIFKNRDDIELAGWTMKGGTDDPEKISQWQPLPAATVYDRPRFYSNEFELPATSAAQHPVWRVSFKGLSQGSVWVNGHNLGRYPEKVPVNSMYIPECWLSKKNKIIIYDEDGKRPDAVTIEPEKASSRNLGRISLW